MYISQKMLDIFVPSSEKGTSNATFSLICFTHGTTNSNQPQNIQIKKIFEQEIVTTNGIFVNGTAQTDIQERENPTRAFLEICKKNTNQKTASIFVCLDTESSRFELLPFLMNVHNKQCNTPILSTETQNSTLVNKVFILCDQFYFK